MRAPTSGKGACTGHLDCGDKAKCAALEGRGGRTRHQAWARASWARWSGPGAPSRCLTGLVDTHAERKLAASAACEREATLGSVVAVDVQARPVTEIDTRTMRPA